jgi:hypothetical protein
MTGRAFEYCLVFAVAILVGIGFPRKCSQSIEVPKAGLIHPAMSLTRIGGELVEPPRLAFHPADATRALSDRHESATVTLRRARDARSGSAVARPGIGRSTWLLLAGGGLLTLSLILRWQLARSPVAQATNPASAESMTNVLESLIANRMPIVEEALPLPHEAQIFGRPLLESPYRCDAAHVLHGPHFAIESMRPVKAATTTDWPVRHPPMARPVPSARVVDQAHSPAGRGELDRALATLQGDQA